MGRLTVTVLGPAPDEEILGRSTNLSIALNVPIQDDEKDEKVRELIVAIGAESLANDAVRKSLTEDENEGIQRLSHGNVEEVSPTAVSTDRKTR